MLANLQDVRDALESDALVPCFQPLIELRSGLLTGFEVLARWQHPTLGLLLPLNFISIAEENGLIGALTLQILGKAFRAASKLSAPVSLAINVSPTQFRDWSLPSLVREAAKETGFPLTRLTIEITESAIIDNVEMASEIAIELKRMGCRLALDDFGTGYSSLLHLQALPFDELKVDRSFVQGMSARRESRKIVGAVVGLGHSLGVLTVAEGVETVEQAEMLLRLGCKIGQGYLYGKPSVAELIPHMLAAPARIFAPREPDPFPRLDSFGLESLPAQQSAQLRAIYDGAPAGLCFLDTAMRYVSINRKLAEMNGTPVIEHLGKTPAEMAPDLFPKIEPYLRGALNGKSFSGLEVSRPGPKPGDPNRTLLLSYEPAFDEVGEVVGVSVGAVDITSRKQAEDAAHTSEDYHRSFVEMSPHAPWVGDAKGNILEVSPRWLELTGLTREQSLGVGWLQALHPDDVDLRVGAQCHAIAAGTPIDIEYRMKSRDGAWRWVRSQSWPRRRSSGEIDRWYGCLEDIDDRKRETERLLRLLHESEDDDARMELSDRLEPRNTPYRVH